MGNPAAGGSPLEDFLADHDFLTPTMRDLPLGFSCDAVFTSGVGGGVELLYLTGHAAPRAEDLRRAWRERSARRAVPVLAVAAYPTGDGPRADIVGLRDDQPHQRGVDLARLERAAEAALDAGSILEAERLLQPLFEREEDTGLPAGLRNEGLFAAWELTEHVPGRQDWADAGARGRALRGHRNIDLLTALGWKSSPLGSTGHLIGDGDEDRAVAVLLQDDELFERRSRRWGDVSPVERGLGLAHKHRVKWVVAVQGDLVRLYSASADVGVGRKGASSTYTELHLAALDDERLAYVPLLMSPRALARGGSVEQILDSSADHATSLGARLRDRVYKDAVPVLAETVADRLDATTDAELARAYHVTLVILFRLLFVAYAEDRALLPYKRNTAYTGVALKTRARAYAEQHREHGKVTHSDAAFAVWNDLKDIWRAVDRGHSEWGVPAYSGGLFSDVDDRGHAIAGLRLTDSEIGPALVALLVDTGKDGTYGPVDFRALSVREFGTIYEGLLESSLSIAPVPLMLDEHESYVPAGPRDTIDVRAGQVYFHNASGARKATGSYFTKQFAVEHLLGTALEPVIDDHLARVSALLDAGDEAGASEAFFDLRVADIAMGSGHFLIGAVDHIALRMSAFLADHSLADVDAELGRLREIAVQSLAEVGVTEIPEIDPANLLRRQVARRCIYGVDINQIAVDLARLALWIHTFVPGLPMSSLEHGLVQGNALTGIGTLDEALELLSPSSAKPGSASGMRQMSLFEGSIREALTASRDLLVAVKRTAEATAGEVAEAAAAYRGAREAAVPATELLDAALAGRLDLIDLRGVSIYGPDAVRAAARAHEVQQDLQELQVLHFPVAFPEVFMRERPGFDVILGNPPWEEVTVEETSFWAEHFPGLKRRSSAEQEVLTAQYRRDRLDLVGELERRVQAVAVLRTALLRGPFPGMGTGDPELYKAFCWRFRHLNRQGGSVGVVLSRSSFMTKGSAPWRLATLSDTHLRLVYAVNEREWLFTDVNPGWPVALVTARRSESASAGGAVDVVGPLRNRADFDALVDRGRISIDVEALLRNDPEACIPAFGEVEDPALFARLQAHPSIGARRDDFEVRGVRELDATLDGKKKFFTNDPEDHPVYNHTHVGVLEFTAHKPFNHVRFDEVARHLQGLRERTFRRSDSAFLGSNDGWVHDARTHPLLHPRITIRDVVHASNPQKVWAAVVPARTVLTNKAPYLHFRRGDAVTQAYLLGMLNSAPVNWFGHMRVGLNLNFFIFYSIPVPEFDASAAPHRRIAELAARLSLASLGLNSEAWGSFGDAIVHAPARIDALCEIHAIGALLYGFTRADLPPLLRWSSELLPQVREHYDQWASA